MVQTSNFLYDLFTGNIASEFRSIVKQAYYGLTLHWKPEYDFFLFLYPRVLILITIIWAITYYRSHRIFFTAMLVFYLYTFLPKLIYIELPRFLYKQYDVFLKVVLQPKGNLEFKDFRNDKYLYKIGSIYLQNVFFFDNVHHGLIVLLCCLMHIVWVICIFSYLGHANVSVKNQFITWMVYNICFFLFVKYLVADVYQTCKYARCLYVMGAKAWR